MMAFRSSSAFVIAVGLQRSFWLTTQGAGMDLLGAFNRFTARPTGENHRLHRRLSERTVRESKRLDEEHEVLPSDLELNRKRLHYLMRRELACEPLAIGKIHISEPASPPHNLPFNRTVRTSVLKPELFSDLPDALS